jgi:hypothetical protein
MKEARKEYFRRGFAAGLSSPYRFMYVGGTRIVRPHKDLVSLSWETVGNAVGSAIESERHDVGEAAKSFSRSGRAGTQK